MAHSRGRTVKRDHKLKPTAEVRKTLPAGTGHAAMRAAARKAETDHGARWLMDIQSAKYLEQRASHLRLLFRMKSCWATLKTFFFERWRPHIGELREASNFRMNLLFLRTQNNDNHTTAPSCVFAVLVPLCQLAVSGVRIRSENRHGE